MSTDQVTPVVTGTRFRPSATRLGVRRGVLRWLGRQQIEDAVVRIARFRIAGANRPAPNRLSSPSAEPNQPCADAR